MFNDKDSRYIVLLQTKEHKNIPPMNNVSYQSLGTFIYQVFVSQEWYYFRSMYILKEEITTLAIYDLTFSRYKTNLLQLSQKWEKLYKGFLPKFLLDFLVCILLYRKEVQITNNKPKYLKNIRDEIISEICTRLTTEIKVEYKDKKILINKKEIPFLQESSIIQDIMNLYFEAREWFDHKVWFEKLRKYYSSNKELFPNLKSKKFEYETFRRWISIKNEEIEKKFWISNFFGIDVSWIQCVYYQPE